MVYSQVLYGTEILKNILWQKGQGVVVQPPVNVEGTRKAEQR